MPTERAESPYYHEDQRQSVLDGFDIPALDNRADLKRITDFAARLCDAPTALLSIVERDRQWFPAQTGSSLGPTPRETSFCAHAMRGTGVMVVNDARLDPRFAENPLVTGEPHIRFYAGAPLVTEDGVPLGALCVIDGRPRSGLTPLQREGLETLAASIMQMLDLHRSARRSHREIDEHEAKFRILADAMPQMVWSTQPDGFHDYYNARWYEFTGMPIGSTDGEGWNGMFHPDDRERAWDVWRHCLETGDPYEIEYRLRNARGEYRWTLGRALPLRDEGGRITRWFGTCTDIHDQKMIQAQREIIAQELSHRIKNIFSVISGLISFSTRHHPQVRAVADDLRERILALGRAHDFVRPHSEQSRPAAAQESLLAMLENLLGAYAERIAIIGDEVLIDDRSATPLALLFHELATNAAKYGALSAMDGRVEIRSEAGPDVTIVHWQERGGPPVTPPATEGFGSKLIELSAVRQLGGEIHRAWLPEGVYITLRIPNAALHRAQVSAAT